jgi:hypothetical protein
VAFAVGIASCGGHAPAVVTPPVEQTIHQQIAQEDGVPWNAARPLAWTDFRAEAPEGGQEGALTGYSLLYGVRCVKTTFQFEVEAVFMPHRSWVKPVVLADPGERERTLRHEQTHFDLTEVYARRLRKHLHEIYDPCTDINRVQDGAERLIQLEPDAQRQYDEDTRHGLDRTRQRAWDEDVKGWLVELEGYGSK